MNLDRLETIAIELVAKLAPWAAPAPTAYVVGRASIQHLAWPLPVALVAALVVECLGLATTATALTLWDYNRSKRQTDPRAPVALSLALVAAYFTAAITLTVLLDIAPDLATYAPGLFPLLSLAGTITLALRADHRRRLQAIADDRQKRSQSSKRAADERKTQAQAAAQQRQRAAELEQALGQLGATAMQTLRSVAANPRQSHADIAQSLNVTRQTVGHHLGRLEDLELIERNGHGIQVLVDLPPGRGVEHEN